MAGGGHADGVAEAQLVAAQVEQRRADRGRPAGRGPGPPRGRRSTSTDSRAPCAPAALARATTGSNIASDSSTVRLRLALAKDSVALPKTATSRAPERQRPVQAALVGHQHRAAGPRRARSPAAASAARRRPVGAPTWGGRSWSPRSWSARRRPAGGRTPPSPRSARSPSRSAARRARRPRGSAPARAGPCSRHGHGQARSIAFDGVAHSASSWSRGDDREHLVHGDRRARGHVQLGDGAGVRGGDDVLHLHRLHHQQALARPSPRRPSATFTTVTVPGMGAVSASAPAGAGAAAQARPDRVVVAHLPGVAVPAQPVARRGAKVCVTPSHVDGEPLPGPADGEPGAHRGRPSPTRTSAARRCRARGPHRLVARHPQVVHGPGRLAAQPPAARHRERVASSRPPAGCRCQRRLAQQRRRRVHLVRHPGGHQARPASRSTRPVSSSPATTAGWASSRRRKPVLVVARPASPSSGEGGPQPAQRRRAVGAVRDDLGQHRVVAGCRPRCPRRARSRCARPSPAARAAPAPCRRTAGSPPPSTGALGADPGLDRVPGEA